MLVELLECSGATSVALEKNSHSINRFRNGVRWARDRFEHSEGYAVKRDNFEDIALSAEEYIGALEAEISRLKCLINSNERNCYAE